MFWITRSKTHTEDNCFPQWRQWGQRQVWSNEMVSLTNRTSRSSNNWLVVWNHGIFWRLIINIWLTYGHIWLIFGNLWLSICWECHHPQLTIFIIFQRGRYTTNQTNLASLFQTKPCPSRSFFLSFVSHQHQTTFWDWFFHLFFCPFEFWADCNHYTGRFGKPSQNGPTDVWLGILVKLR